MKYALLQSLLPLVARYEAENPAAGGPSMEDFAVWLHTAIAEEQAQYHSPVQMPDDYETNHDEAHNNVYTQSTRFLYALHHYAKNYVKKALHDSPLQSGEEFGYLAMLLERGDLSKTELINLHINGKTSGMDIIRRLYVQGLIEEKPDAEDKRSKRVSLSQAGKGALFAAFEEMNNASFLLTVPLSSTEKLTFFHLLRKLDTFHQEMNARHRDNTLGEILAETVGKK